MRSMVGFPGAAVGSCYTNGGEEEDGSLRPKLRHRGKFVGGTANERAEAASTDTPRGDGPYGRWFLRDSVSMGTSRPQSSSMLPAWVSRLLPLQR